jgi:hypothetical protein
MFSKKLISAAMSVMVVGCAMPLGEEDLSSSSEELSFSGSFKPRPRFDFPTPPTPPLLRIDTLESDIAEGLCNALQEYNARLPYIGRHWCYRARYSRELWAAWAMGIGGVRSRKQEDEGHRRGRWSKSRVMALVVGSSVPRTRATA